MTQSSSKIPIEIITEEEMSSIKSALAAAAPMSAQFHRNVRSIQSITQLSKRRLLGCTQSDSPPTDIEDAGRVGENRSNSPQSYVKKMKIGGRVRESFLNRFRRRRGLSVTDITATEWCEKKMEFILLIGKPEKTKAMKAGSARHVVLEEEVVKRVKFCVETVEDAWALKLINFIIGTNQLLLDGLTRELPVVAFLEGVWVVGIIDEIRMPLRDSEKFTILVDTKTRDQATLPSEAQKRNGRLQLMCYKYIWDNLVADKFSMQKFFDFFSLNPHYILSREIRDYTSKSGFASETLDDLVRCFRNSCSLLPRAQDQLLLRYEFQEDNSLIGEDFFPFEPDWVKDQIKSCLEFWHGNREANYTPMEERWKCRYCKFASSCPTNSDLDHSTNQRSKEEENLDYSSNQKSNEENRSQEITL